MTLLMPAGQNLVTEREEKSICYSATVYLCPITLLQLYFK